MSWDTLKKMLILEILFSSSLTLENISTTYTKEEAKFGGIVCNAGKDAHVKNCSEILIPYSRIYHYG